jgi:hypothetical protein
MKGFYYIENTVNEYRSEPSVYTETLEEAKEAMKYCDDWYGGKGTGKIFFQPLEFEVEERSYVPYGETEPVKYKAIRQKSAEFICRGIGLNREGEVIFSDKMW